MSGPSEPTQADRRCAESLSTVADKLTRTGRGLGAVRLLELEGQRLRLWEREAGEGK